MTIILHQSDLDEALQKAIMKGKTKQVESHLTLQSFPKFEIYGRKGARPDKGFMKDTGNTIIYQGEETVVLQSA